MDILVPYPCAVNTRPTLKASRLLRVSENRRRTSDVLTQVLVLRELYITPSTTVTSVQDVENQVQGRVGLTWPNRSVQTASFPWKVALVLMSACFPAATCTVYYAVTIYRVQFYFAHGKTCNPLADTLPILPKKILE
ncbi:hypothetical protein GWI33_001287 [Rhynchophorus ferrugineus]|uniref:Uncharacterized protein n=1 Tax=Rhynchophorus ferrugineus TaxID=354439 RepID=A0A834HYD0_RHYFE|nr:hypothetical protein GWI33_001287 [Rhynchophorus ferrugineus]